MPKAKKKSAETIDVLEILRDQHTDVDDLIAKLESGKGDREAIFTELADKLAAHATVEEQIFYPGVMNKQTAELLHESVEEHLAVKRILADMLALDLDEDEDVFNAKLAVLKDTVSHHAHEEEEGELFPILEDILDEDDRAGLGNDVLAMFEELLEGEPRQQVPEETTAAAPLPAL
ncbi:MAG TPA: hemerythrin domain-containing protein [Kofleriaceae bacterium]|nr:hemerythrin domain-containing protein [Kofleriaceae bacterium]